MTGRGECALGLARLGGEVVDGGDDLLDLGVGEFDGREDDLFGLFLGARLDHHDAVFVADDHDVDGGVGALGISGIDDELAVDPADANCADGGAERNVGERQGAGGGVDADHVGIIFLVGGEDQGDDLGFVAEAVREKRADGAIDLARGQDFLLAGTAFALDEAAGDASTGIRVFAVVDGEGEKIDAFAGIGRCDSGGQNDGFARRYQGRARGLLGHASGLKDQPFAAGKLDGYFMLRRHRVLFSFFRLGNLG